VGAEAWQVLVSVLRTATQQTRDPVQLLVGLLQTPTPSWPTSRSPDADEHRNLNTGDLHMVAGMTDSWRARAFARWLLVIPSDHEPGGGSGNAGVQ
jgi:hypothetical protein